MPRYLAFQSGYHGPAENAVLCNVPRPYAYNTPSITLVPIPHLVVLILLLPLLQRIFC